MTSKDCARSVSRLLQVSKELFSITLDTIRFTGVTVPHSKKYPWDTWNQDVDFIDPAVVLGNRFGGWAASASKNTNEIAKDMERFDVLFNYPWIFKFWGIATYPYKEGTNSSDNTSKLYIHRYSINRNKLHKIAKRSPFCTHNKMLVNSTYSRIQEIGKATFGDGYSYTFTDSDICALIMYDHPNLLEKVLMHHMGVLRFVAGYIDFPFNMAVIEYATKYSLFGSAEVAYVPLYVWHCRANVTYSVSARQLISTLLEKCLYVYSNGKADTPTDFCLVDALNKLFQDHPYWKGVAHKLENLLSTAIRNMTFNYYSHILQLQTAEKNPSELFKLFEIKSEIELVQFKKETFPWQLSTLQFVEYFLRKNRIHLQNAYNVLSQHIKITDDVMDDETKSRFQKHPNPEVACAAKVMWEHQENIICTIFEIMTTYGGYEACF